MARSPAVQDGAPRDRGVEAIVSRAAALPPEFAADALLRLASSPAVPDPSWKSELIEEAYIRALSAQEPFARGAPFAPPDSTAAALTRGYDTGLDRVSLQSRAALAMVPLSASRARELFEWIDFDLPPVTDAACEEPLVPSLDGYYDTLASMARSAFGSAPDARADALWFLELYLWRASRAPEMASVSRAVLRYRAAGAEASYLESVVRWILRHGVRDPRGFSTAGAELLSRTADLDKYSRGAGGRGNTLLHGLREYLVQQTTGPRCADSFVERPVIDAFNRLIASRNATDLRPIAGTETRPSRLLGSARLVRLWQTMEARRLRDRAAEINGDPRRPLSQSAKQQRSWQEQADALLTDVEQWSGSREPVERDFVYQKAVLLTGLTEVAPPSPVRTRALRATLNFLRHHNSSREQRNLWFTHATRLLDIARGEDRSQVLEALATSGEPVLAMHAELARMQPVRELRKPAVAGVRRPPSVR